MRGLGAASDFEVPEIGAVEVAGAAFVFRYGAVVLFGVDTITEARFLERLRPHLIDPLKVHETDAVEIELRTDVEEQIDSRGTVLLHALTLERAELVAMRLRAASCLRATKSGSPRCWNASNRWPRPCSATAIPVWPCVR